MKNSTTIETLLQTSLGEDYDCDIECRENKIGKSDLMWEIEGWSPNKLSQISENIRNKSTNRIKDKKTYCNKNQVKQRQHLKDIEHPALSILKDRLNQYNSPDIRCGNTIYRLPQINNQYVLPFLQPVVKKNQIEPDFVMGKRVVAFNFTSRKQLHAQTFYVQLGQDKLKGKNKNRLNPPKTSMGRNREYFNLEKDFSHKGEGPLQMICYPTDSFVPNKRSQFVNSRLKNYNRKYTLDPVY